jgi:hypothetical protein
MVVGAVAVVIGVVLVVFALGSSSTHKREISQRQARLQPFYTPPAALPAGAQGSVIRSEPLGVKVPQGGTGLRVLYRTQRADGTPAVASGMVFLPPGRPQAGGWPVVAWAHPTVGLGDACAPSRTPAPLADMSWLGDMMQRGWVVTATDYAGLGTPGQSQYLVGAAEANDVLNSVRAARHLADGRASRRFALYGHSQGGHAVLWAMARARRYAPELKLVATAAAAPATQMVSLLSEQWQSTVVWAIAPEIFESWPTVNPGLSAKQVSTPTGLRNSPGLASACLSGEGFPTQILKIAALQFAGVRVFKLNPMTNSAWYRAAARQVPPTPILPTLISQGTIDTVVLPDTTALYARRSCEAGANLTLAFLGKTGHSKAGAIAGPYTTSWLYDRFAGRPTRSTCDQPMPFAPAAIPAAPPS